MSQHRKTVDVQFVLDRVNTLLAQVETTSPAERQAAASVLESVLHETGTYAGFQFTDGTQGNTDRTQRRYYTHRSLTTHRSTRPICPDCRAGCYLDGPCTCARGCTNHPTTSKGT